MCRIRLGSWGLRPEAWLLLGCAKAENWLGLAWLRQTPESHLSLGVFSHKVSLSGLFSKFYPDSGGYLQFSCLYSDCDIYPPKKNTKFLLTNTRCHLENDGLTVITGTVRPATWSKWAVSFVRWKWGQRGRRGGDDGRRWQSHHAWLPPPRLLWRDFFFFRLGNTVTRLYVVYI